VPHLLSLALQVLPSDHNDCSIKYWLSIKSPTLSHLFLFHI
jgi:hypothetical protein